MLTECCWSQGAPAQLLVAGSPCHWRSQSDFRFFGRFLLKIKQGQVLPNRVHGQIWLHDQSTQLYRMVFRTIEKITGMSTYYPAHPGVSLK